MSSVTERRRSRRVGLSVPIQLRPDTPEAPGQATLTGQVKDASLAGIYCHVTAPCPFKPGDSVVCSLTIDPEQAEEFPFARILGKGWVSRVEPVPKGRRAGESGAGQEVLGVAVVFAADVTALGTV